MKNYCWTHIWVVSVWFLTSYKHSWIFFKTAYHKCSVWQRMLSRWKYMHCSHGQLCFRFMVITTIWNHSILIGFKNTTFHFTIPSVVRVVTMVFKFFRVKIVPCSQRHIIYFVTYTTLTPTPKLFTCRHLFNLGWNNVSYLWITDNDIIVLISWTFYTNLLWWTYHDSDEFSGRHI